MDTLLALKALLKLLHLSDIVSFQRLANGRDGHRIDIGIVALVAELVLVQLTLVLDRAIALIHLDRRELLHSVKLLVLLHSSGV